LQRRKVLRQWWFSAHRDITAAAHQCTSSFKLRPEGKGHFLGGKGTTMACVNYLTGEIVKKKNNPRRCDLQAILLSILPTPEAA